MYWFIRRAWESQRIVLNTLAKDFGTHDFGENKSRRQKSQKNRVNYKRQGMLQVGHR